jgi:hypothetical protein
MTNFCVTVYFHMGDESVRPGEEAANRHFTVTNRNRPPPG